MLAFEFKEGANRVEAGVEESYRQRSGEDAAWPPANRAYGGHVETAWTRTMAVLQVGLQLVVPILLLLSLLCATYLYADRMLAPLRGVTLTEGDLLLPLGWFALHLTNRRFGPGHAFAQLLVVLLAALLIVAIDPYGIDHWSSIPLDLRVMLAFGAAFLIASFVGITIFDGARGPRWWTAPLLGSLTASLVFSAIFYPAAFAGTRAHWNDVALVHFGVFFAEAVLLLVPYWLLRGMIRPQSGLNGY